MAIYKTLYPQGNFLDIRANAPTSTDYNIQVMEDLVRNLPGGGIRDLLAPAAAATLSLPYDAIQAATRTTEDDISRAMETAGMYGQKDIASEAYGLSFGRERPLSSAIERTIGASGPLAERINNLNLFNSAVAAEKPTVPNVSLGTPQINFNTGITGASSAIPNINGVPMINTGAYNQKLQNTDLVSQIIAANQAANANKFGNQVPLDMNRFQGVSDMSIIDETTNDEQDQDYIDQVNNNKQNGLMSFLRSLPTPTNLLLNMLPKQDPRATNMRNFYGNQYGLTSTGSLSSGIMQGYNPVSGGLLNMITGGKFGKPTQYGLSGAMQRRIENILGRRAPQTDASRSKLTKLRNLQKAEMQDRSGRGESLGSIGRSTFSGPGMAFEKQSGGSSGKKGTSSERNYGGR